MKQFYNSSNKFIQKHLLKIPPKNNRNILLDLVKPHLKNNADVLDPYTRTGEFIKDINKFDISLNIYGIEEDEYIFDTFCDISNSTIYNTNFLTLSSQHNLLSYDLIFGSPPSFIIDKNTQYGKMFKLWTRDKTDIYSLYILRAIDLLKDGGILAFIVPDTILNSPTTQLLRNRIHSNGSVLSIKRLSNLFTKTNYNTVSFVFQKFIQNDNKYIFNVSNHVFFSLDTPLYKRIFNNCTFFSLLNVHIQKGHVNYNSIRSNNSKTFPIIYTKNITDNSISLYNNSKQYISIKHCDFKLFNKPSLIISKGYGCKKNEHSLNYSLCTLEKYTTHENMFVITFPNLDNESAIIKISSIVTSLNNEQTKNWCKQFLHNGIITLFQIKHYLPLFL
tara:strand:- start:1386 stop:2552 length:1167 start_codon:yes stop_codon:yes gene_type:complete